jgi:transcriptional regulator with XRE-family HTH domain
VKGQQSDWERELARGVGKRIAYYRRERRVSAETLAAACTALGLPMSRPVIAKIENQLRGVLTVAELLVIAQALQVPPAALLFGHGLDDAIQVLPGNSMSPWKALQWFAGPVTWESTITKTAVPAP